MLVKRAPEKKPVPAFNPFLSIGTQPEPQYTPTEQVMIAWMKDCGWVEGESGVYNHNVSDTVYIAWGDAVHSCIEAASGV